MTRLRFSIRDLLWLTALCAALVAWWIDHERLSPKPPKMALIVPHGPYIQDEDEENLLGTARMP
jgi:hypothetical protein